MDKLTKQELIACLPEKVRERLGNNAEPIENYPDEDPRGVR